MLFRPYGLVIGGALQIGLELELRGGCIQRIGPHTGMPEPYVISSAFVNAHSHLEYRGLLGEIQEDDYYGWIRRITDLKKTQTAAGIREDCELAARENRAAGVARIGEHSDRPYAGATLAKAGIDGIVFQELITFFERESPQEKIRLVQEKAKDQEKVFPGEVQLAPHAPYTVDERSLKWISMLGKSLSIHVAESLAENQFFLRGEGPIAEFYEKSGNAFRVPGKSAVQWLGDLGLARENAQFVHCCDVSTEDIRLMAGAGVKVAHCPRSNERLGCPRAPVREMLDAGISVGLGMDSAASSGPIDMFAEMRAALEVSLARGKPLTAEEVWSMATSMGNQSLPFTRASNRCRWDVYEGSSTPLIIIHVEGPQSVEDLIRHGTPAKVDWVGK